MENEHIAALRKEYLRDSIDPSDFPAEPVAAFADWFDLVLAEQCPEPNAMVLSTVGANGRPSSRVVLLKDCTAQGLVFFTNYKSRKGEELFANPYACLNFFWHDLERQIRVEGKVEPLPSSVNDAYFNSRPRLSQAGALASMQSSIILDRQGLDAEMQRLMSLPESEALVRPSHWGGYCLVPDYFEFWQGRAGRVHDRICYELNVSDWRKFRRSP